MRKVPGLDLLLQKLIGATTERSIRLVSLASAVRVTERQFGKVSLLFDEACGILDVKQKPELFVSQSQFLNAGAIGLAIDTIADYIIPLPTLYPTQERFAMGYFTVGIQKGDLNGDDKTDLVFNSTQNVVDSNFISIVSNGKFYIYLGREIPVDTADFVFIGSGKYNFIGDFVEVGNINGDSYDDLLYSSNQPRTIGSAYDSINYLNLFYGSENFSAIQGNESELYSSFVNPPDSTAGWFIRNFSARGEDSAGLPVYWRMDSVRDEGEQRRRAARKKCADHGQ